MPDKTPSVYRCRTIFFQCFYMCGRAITFIGSESVFRHQGVVFYHETVSGHFCHNARRSDGNALGIAFDDGNLFDLHFRNVYRIV